jgi:hypothetical protein
MTFNKKMKGYKMLSKFLQVTHSFDINQHKKFNSIVELVAVCARLSVLFLLSYGLAWFCFGLFFRYLVARSS